MSFYVSLHLPFQEGVSWERVGHSETSPSSPPLLRSHSFKSPSPSPSVFARFGVAGDGTEGVLWMPQCAEVMGKKSSPGRYIGKRRNYHPVFRVHSFYNIDFFVSSVMKYGNALLARYMTPHSSCTSVLIDPP